MRKTKACLAGHSLSWPVALFCNYSLSLLPGYPQDSQPLVVPAALLTVLAMDSWDKDCLVSLWQRKVPASARSWANPFWNGPCSNPRQDKLDPNAQ